MQRLWYVAVIALAIAGCQDAVDPTEPPDDLSLPVIQPSVAVFGVLEIGAPLGGDVGQANAVNDLGEVVGQSQHIAGGLFAFHWINGAVRDLGALVGGGSSEAFDVNIIGESVGRSQDAQSDDHAVMWERTGMIHQLPSLIVGPFDVLDDELATALNDRGGIVGQVTVVNDVGTAVQVGLYWATKDAPATALTHLGGGDATATEINNLGQIVGASRDVGEILRPVFWANKDAAPQPLLPLPGSTDLRGIAFGINELGQIAGAARTSSGGETAVVWVNKDAVPVELGGIGGGLSGAFDINELGQAVGIVTDLTGNRAVLWTPDLTDPTGYLVHDLGAPAGHVSAVAAGLNNMGQVVGRGFAPSARAVLWEVSIHVQVDIVPSPIRLDGKGRVTGTILGSPYFQAASIDPGTLTLGNDDGLETPIARKKKLTPAATLVDVDRDGDTDLVAEFAESELMANGDLTPASTKLTLLGRLRDGKHIRGSDAILVQ